jgi:hypothetical protein
MPNWVSNGLKVVEGDPQEVWDEIGGVDFTFVGETLTFDTPWEPPVQTYEAIARKCPNLKIKIYGHDCENGCFHYDAEISNGKLSGKFRHCSWYQNCVSERQWHETLVKDARAPETTAVAGMTTLTVNLLPSLPEIHVVPGSPEFRSVEELWQFRNPNCESGLAEWREIRELR